MGNIPIHRMKIDIIQQGCVAVDEHAHVIIKHDDVVLLYVFAGEGTTYLNCYARSLPNAYEAPELYLDNGEHDSAYNGTIIAFPELVGWYMFSAWSGRMLTVTFYNHDRVGHRA